MANCEHYLKNKKWVGKARIRHLMDDNNFAVKNQGSRAAAIQIIRIMIPNRSMRLCSSGNVAPNSPFSFAALATSMSSC